MKILLFSLCLLLPNIIIAGEIFKWVDEHGRVHFGDKPADDASQKIEVKKGEENTLSTNQQRTKKRDKLLKAYEEERRIKKENEAKEKQNKAKRQYKCAQEKDSLKTMKHGGSFYDLDKDGNRVFIDETEVKKRIMNMENNIEKYCN